MASDSSVDGKTLSPKKMSLSFYLTVGIVVVFIAILFVIFSSLGTNIPNQNEEESVPGTQPVEIFNFSTLMKPVQSIDEVASSCEAAIGKNDAESFCLDFKKVDFDGLQVFVNCQYAEVQGKLSGQLSCSEFTIDAKSVCERQELNEDEFVSVEGNVRTCAEFSNQPA